MENSSLAAMDTTKAGSEAAQQWSQYNNGLAQQGYYNSLAANNNLKNQTTQEAMDRDALARRIINNNFTAPGQTRTAPGDTQTPTTPTTPTTPNSSQTSYNTSLGSLVPNAYTGPSYAPPTQSLNIPQMPQAPQANQGTPASSTLPLGSLANLGNTPPQIPLQQQKPQASQIPVMDPNSPERTAMRVFPNSAPTSGVTSDPTSHAPIQITPIGSFNRQGAYDEMVANGLGPEAEDLRKQWTNDDLVSEKIKLEKNIAAHAQLVAGIAAFKSLPDSMKPAAYAQEKQGLASLGVNISQMPDKYDPNNPDNVAYVDNLAAQATSAQDKLKDKHSDVEDNIKQQTANTSSATQQANAAYQQGELKSRQANLNETARHNKAQEAIEEEKSMPAVVPSFAVGNSYLSSLPQAQQNYLTGVATGQIPVNPRSKEGQAVVSQAAQAYPDVNISAATKFSQDMGKVNAGTSGGVLVGANKSMEHLGTMIASDNGGSGANLGPNWFSAGINATKNAITGANAKAAWNAEHSALINEMARSFKGGPPGDNETIRDMKNLSFSDSPDRKATVYKAYSDLLQGQTGGVEDLRANAYGSADPKTSLLSTKSQQVVQHLNGGKLPAGMLPAYDDPTILRNKAIKQGNTQSNTQPQSSNNGTLPYMGKTLSQADFNSLPIASQNAFRSGGGMVK